MGRSTKVKGNELSGVLGGVVTGVVSNSADFAARRLYVVDHIEFDQAFKFVVNLGYLDRSRGPIEVVVMSLGGSEPAGWVIYDAMRAARNQIVTTGTGAVGSMGVPIFLAGDVRRMTQECHVMLHSGSLDIGEVEQNMLLARARGLEKTNLRYNQVVSDRTKLSLDEVFKACSSETYYSAEEALAAGFTHEVMPYAKKKEVLP